MGVVVPDPPVGQLQGPAQLVGHPLEGGADLGARDTKAGRGPAVELLGQGHQRRVSLGAHPGQDPRHRLAHVGAGVGRAGQHAVEGSGPAAQVQEREGHGAPMLPGAMRTPIPLGHHRDVTQRAELSSLASSLDELTRRVTALAEQSRASGTDELTAELFAVERALTGALRRLGRMADGRP